VYDSVNLSNMGQSCGRHDNNFLSLILSLSEIQAIRCCPYYLNIRFFLFLCTSVCIAVPMVSFKTLLSYSHISNYQSQPAGRAYSGALLLFHAYRGYVLWYLTLMSLPQLRTGCLVICGGWGLAAWYSQVVRFNIKTLQFSLRACSVQYACYYEC
ncbi:hypothetical protein EDD22DRAFT_914109, partial [Suillus occidentalis]